MNAIRKLIKIYKDKPEEFYLLLSTFVSALPCNIIALFCLLDPSTSNISAALGVFIGDVIVLIGYVRYVVVELFDYDDN